MQFNLVFVLLTFALLLVGFLYTLCNTNTINQLVYLLYFWT